MKVNLKKYPFVNNGIAFISLAKRSLKGKNIEVTNAKSSWVPFLKYVKIKVINVISDNTICDQIDMINYCEKLNPNKLRLLVEVTASLTPLISDTLYQLDNSNIKKDEIWEGKRKYIHITNWQSYGRSYILGLDNKVKNFINKDSSKTNCLLLPCVGKRPYNHSKLKIKEYGSSSYHKVVLSSIGIIPEELWGDKVVLKYQTGVPDIWRVFKLAQNYFINNDYKTILCYLDYAPYVEIMKILEQTLNLNIKYKTKIKYNEYGPKFAIK